MTTSQDTVTKIPYNRIIIAVFALVALYFFKDPISHIIVKSENVDVEVFGFKIKVDKNNLEELDKIRKQYDTDITNMNERFTLQETTIDALQSLNDELKKKSIDCPETRIISDQFSTAVDSAQSVNSDLRHSIRILNSQDFFKVSKPLQTIQR